MTHHRILSHRRHHAFTLVELLVVIGIIGLLLAILLPTITRAWRVASIVGDPVAYVDQYFNVWICDPSGQRQLLMSTKIRAEAGRVRWSPQGSRLAYNCAGGLAVVEVVSGKTKVITNITNACWIDEETIIGPHYISAGHEELWKANVVRGDCSRWLELLGPEDADGWIEADYEPQLSPGFVVCESEDTVTTQMDVVKRGKNWQRKGTVWSDPGNNIEDTGPQIDPTGEWVGWTRGASPGSGPNIKRRVAIKRLSAPSTDPPEIFGASFNNASFCDWAPDGNMLVGIEKPDGKYVMAIMNRKTGQVMRELYTPYGLQTLNYASADWRYHRRW